MDLLALCIASTFFSGFLPEKIGKMIGKKGSGGGLMGSLVAFFIQVLFLWFHLSWMADVGIIVVSLVLGLVCIGRAERYLLEISGPRLRHTGELAFHDFNQTNIDEVHGQAIAGLPIFCGTFVRSGEALVFLVVSLILFRIFDNWKPWPIRLVERSLPGASGIMFDDTIAGIFAALVLYLAYVGYGHVRI